MKTTTILVSALALAAAIPASAQVVTTSQVSSLPLRVQVGGFYPTDSHTRALFGKYQYAGGITYDLKGSSSSTSDVNSIYLDGVYRKQDGNRITAVGLGWQSRSYSRWSSNSRTYGGYGIGVYFVDTDIAGTGKNDTRIGGKMIYGYELRNGYYAELAYNLVQKKNDIGLTGFTAYVGLKF